MRQFKYIENRPMIPSPNQITGPDHGGIGSMIENSVAYVLCRIEDDSSLTPVSEHQDLVTGVAAGTYAVEVEDFDFSYGLYADGVRVASFADGRVGYREWAMRTGRLTPSLDDRYDHDVDELLA